MGNIVKRDNQPPTDEGHGEPSDFPQILHIDGKTVDDELLDMLNDVAQFVNTADIISKIKMGVEYIVQIPREFQSGYEAGEYFIMKGKESGVMWPTLMKISESGRKEIVTPLPIKPNAFVQGEPIQKLSLNFHNFYMKKQIQQLFNIIQETFTTVQRIEMGQVTDRLGLMTSGKDMIILAFSCRDQDERKMKLESGRKSLSDARGQFLTSFKSLVAEYKPIPKNFFIQAIHELFSVRYGNKKDDDYDKLYKYFKLFMDSTQLLAESYAAVGDFNTVEKLYNITKNELEEIDFTNINTITYLHKKSKFKSFGEFVPQIIEDEHRKCIESAKTYDIIELEVSGEKLLEVLSNGESK